MALWRFLIVLPVIAALAYPISKLGSALLAVASLLVVPVLLSHAIAASFSRRRYAGTPGILIDDNGVTFYGDGGPHFHEWSNFGSAIVSPDGRKIIQHLPVQALELTGYDRFSSYFFTPVDYVSATPDETLNAIRSHPKFPRQT